MENFFLKKNKILLFLSLLVVFLFSVFYLGFENLNPNNDTWLNNPDLLSYQLPWKYFKNDIWRFPIFLNPTYGLDYSASILYADNVTILNIFFKLFKNFLSDNFQFYGAWIIICFLLQYYISFKIILNFTSNFNYSVLSSFFFILIPFFIERSFIHLSLAANWIILLSILFLRIFKTEDISKYFLLIILSLLINLHLTINILIFLFLYVLLTEKLKKSLKLLLIYSSFTIFLLYLLGFFSVGLVDNIDFGYGYYKSNILTFFDPKGGILNLDWSLIIPDIKNFTDGEKEGFGYLGIGGIIILYISVFYTIKYKYFKHKNFKIYFIISFLFLVLATSTNLSFGSYEILNIELNKYIYGLLSTIRSSGRFIWIVAYLIIIFGIVTIHFRLPKYKFLVITSLLVLQIVDILPGLKSISGYLKDNNNKFYKKNNDEIWSIAQQNFKYLRHTFPISSPDHLAEYSSILINYQFEGTDIVYLSRSDRQKITKYRYNLYDNFFEKKVNTKSAYIISNNHIYDIYRIFKNSNHGFFFRDNIWLLLPNKKNYMEKRDLDELKKLENKINTFEKNKKIYPKSNLFNFGLGWYSSRSFWSESKNSTIHFKLDKNNIKTVNKIILVGNIFQYKSNKELNINFLLNDKKINSKTENFGEMQKIILDIPNKKYLEKLNYLKIVNFNKETRLSKRIAPDPRLLGIKLNYIELN
ncbi:DUF6311 domain-containing protein [Candidatus Pelagibacter sp.]|nr:DUF6311 domain-containing protein [Candidatus Pelagibacter sp.]